MNDKRYSLIGRLVWNGGKWYVRRTYLQRLSLTRKLAAEGAVALLTLAAAALAARARG
jgi:hypothetical protein